jgi:Fe-S-cluster containining protein
MSTKVPQQKPEEVRSESSLPQHKESDLLTKFEFKCQRCGRCCGLTPFTRTDYKRIRIKAEKLHIPFVKQTIAGHTTYLVKCIVDKVQQVGNIEKVNPKDIVCPFLERNEDKTTFCKIYEDRPMICRMFGTEGWRGITLCCPYQNIGAK